MLQTWRRGDRPHDSDAGATWSTTCLVAVLIAVSSPIKLLALS